MQILDLVLGAGLVVQLVLLLLVFASVVCWAVIAFKFKLFRTAHGENQKFLSLFWNSKNLEDIFSQSESQTDSPIAVIFRNGYKELQKLSGTERTSHGKVEVENIERALARAAQDRTAHLERSLGILASTASAAPFVGLFGTVWGIMHAFQRIGASGTANLAVVAPAISEALIATAIGLAAAIPAAVAYNHFVGLIRRQTGEMDCFIQDFLNIVQRGLLSEAKSEGET